MRRFSSRPLPALVETLESRRLLSVTYHVVLTTPDGKGLDPNITPEYYLVPTAPNTPIYVERGDLSGALSAIERDIKGGEIASDPYPAITSHWDSYSSVGTDNTHLFNIRNLRYDPVTFCYTAQIGHQAYAEGTQLPVQGQYNYYWNVVLQADVDWTFFQQGLYVSPADRQAAGDALRVLLDDTKQAQWPGAYQTLDELMKQPPIRQDVQYSETHWTYDPGVDLNLRALLDKHPATSASVSIGMDGSVSVSTGSVAATDHYTVYVADGGVNEQPSNDLIATFQGQNGPGTPMRGTGDDGQSFTLTGKMTAVAETTCGVLEIHLTYHTPDPENPGQFIDAEIWIRQQFAIDAWGNWT